MRVSPLHDKLAGVGASFTERYGIEITSRFSDVLTEYNYVRNSVGLTDFSYLKKYTIPEKTGLDFLDDLFAGNVAKIRFGRILHTFLANEKGDIVADCYIANNDEEYVLLCESIISDEELDTIFREHGASEAGLEDITGEYVVLGIDGFKAWAVVKEIFGVDVLGLPYLSIEMYPFEDRDIHFFRAGKTSEFGYLVMAPQEIKDALFDTLLETTKKNEGGLCGTLVHNDLRLEGRFFNIFAEGSNVKDPLSLGLQWMIDFDKEAFLGIEEIYKRREAGLTQKIIGVSTQAQLELFKPDALIYNGNDQVATVKAVCNSPILNCRIGLALFSIDFAFSGLSFRLGSAEGEEVKTISMPPIMPKSLTVKLDEL
jgi:aminomethyltransferase